MANSYILTQNDISGERGAFSLQPGRSSNICDDDKLSNQDFRMYEHHSINARSLTENISSANNSDVSENLWEKLVAASKPITETFTCGKIALKPSLKT